MWSFGFGIEYLGLMCCRWPGMSSVIVILISLVAGLGLPHLAIDADLRNVFRSKNPEFILFERASRTFPAADRDVLILATGKTLSTRLGIQTLQRLHQELQLADGVADIISLSSARNSSTDLTSLLPNPLPRGTAFTELMRHVSTHPMIRGKLLSIDQQSTLLVVRLDRNYPDLEELRPLISKLRNLAIGVAHQSGLQIQFSGIPVMRVEITDAVLRDQIVFNLLGGVIGLLVCVLFFRNWRFVLIAIIPSGVAVFWALGGMGLVEQKITYLTNVVPILVMVITYCDSMHLTFGIQVRMDNNLPMDDAILSAIREIGPACLLTSLTTAMALLSFAFARSDYVAEFGVTAGMAVLTAYVSVVTLTPLLAKLFLRENTSLHTDDGPVIQGKGLAVQISQASATIVGHAPILITMTCVVILIIAGFMYLLNEPSYQFRENLPRDNDAYRAIEKIDRELSGTNEVKILVEWPQSTDLKTILHGVRAAHKVLAADQKIKAVWSIDSLSQYIDPEGDAASRDIQHRLAESPEEIVKRLIVPHEQMALISGFLESGISSQMNTFVTSLESRLDLIRTSFPTLSFSLTGFSIMSARLSEEMINELRLGLLGAVVLIVLLIGVGFRSIRLALYSLPPNLFPLALTGGALYLTNSGLQFTSVIALTVAFGIAVDDSIHFLNAFRLQLATGLEPQKAARYAIHAVGPVLIATTAILSAGLGLTFLSELPMVQLFGILMILVLIVALIADLLFLPALICTLPPKRGREKEASQ